MTDEPLQAAAREPFDGPRLMISGWLQVDPADGPVLINREMRVVASDGVEVGWVAAVLVAGAERGIRCVLLQRLGPMPEYRKVAPALIARVTEDRVALHISSDQVNQLPAHESGARRTAL